MYFLEVYKDYAIQYSYLNAIAISACGFISALIGGIISDKYENKGLYKMKANICIFAGILGIPAIALCTLVQNNFWFSITMLGVQYLVAECWIGPSITMVVNTISAQNKGFAVSIYILMATFSGSLSTFIPPL